ncbi:MAG: hypothetical protein WBA00_12965 [Rhodococcus sp. (in: high G+C Gram-positive bacteria)]
MTNEKTTTLHTLEIQSRDFEIPDGASFLFGQTDSEERGRVSSGWLKARDPALFIAIEISEQNEDSFLIKLPASRDLEVSLHDVAEIRTVLNGLSSPLYLDITSLSHHTWAPLVSAAIEESIELFVVYIEPEEYRKSNETEDMFIDLSERTGGIRPLPGFANLAPKVRDAGFFVPILGFEGARFANIFQSIEADFERTYPIIGVPGFRPEYSFYSFDGNKSTLGRNHLYRQVQFAKANCPFSVFHVLDMVHEWSDYTHLRVAPIGTKPHALGSVLFAISRGVRVELIYDHPVRAKRSTIGEGRLCIYDVTTFTRTRAFVPPYECNAGYHES